MKPVDSFLTAVNHFFLTSKPYSYASELSIGLLFCLFLKPHNVRHSLITAAALTLLMWLYFNWQSDYIQKDPGRIKPPFWLWFVPLFISSGIGFISGGLWGIFGVCLYAAAIILYSFKAKIPALGMLGPFFRVLTVAGNFFMISFALACKPDRMSIIFLILLAVLKGTRNLVGDVRDMKTDKWEIPAKFGDKAAFIIVNFAFIFELVLILLVLKGNMTFPATIIFILTWFILILLYFCFHRNSPHQWGYWGHRFLIIMVTIFQTLLAYQFGLPVTWVFLIVGLLVALQFCYTILPGKNFPSWKEFSCRFTTSR
jgi:hypothetical protein